MSRGRQAELQPRRDLTGAHRLEQAHFKALRWTFAGMAVLAGEALIAFSLDWVHDELVHRILLAVLALGGIAVVLVVFLALGAQLVYWRERAKAR